MYIGQLPELDIESFEDINEIRRWLVVLEAFKHKENKERALESTSNNKSQNDVEKTEQSETKTNDLKVMSELSGGDGSGGGDNQKFIVDLSSLPRLTHTQYSENIEKLTAKLNILLCNPNKTSLTQRTTSTTSKSSFFEPNEPNERDDGNNIKNNVLDSSSTSLNNKNVKKKEMMPLSLHDGDVGNMTTTKTLRQRLKSALPLPPQHLPGIHNFPSSDNETKDSHNNDNSTFVASYELVGVGISEELGEEEQQSNNDVLANIRGGTEVMVNSEGSVFFLFFKYQNHTTSSVDEQEYVFVLKFSGTDVRTRSEGFANQLATSFGVCTP